MNHNELPGIPGDDIPLTPEEEAHFDELANKLVGARHAPRFTPPPVKGYRALSQVEVDLMNVIKAEGETLDTMVKQVQGHLLLQRRDAARLSPITASDAELTRLSKAESERWTALARTHLQEGLMALTRAVAQPSSF